MEVITIHLTSTNLYFPMGTRTLLCHLTVKLQSLSVCTHFSFSGLLNGINRLDKSEYTMYIRSSKAELWAFELKVFFFQTTIHTVVSRNCGSNFFYNFQNNTIKLDTCE